MLNKLFHRKIPPPDGRQQTATALPVRRSLGVGGSFAHVIFRRKSRSNQIKEVTRMIYRINRIVLAYKKDKNYQPTDEMLKQLGQIAEACWITHGVVEHVERCLHQRRAGEPEG